MSRAKQLWFLHAILLGPCSFCCLFSICRPMPLHGVQADLSTEQPWHIHTNHSWSTIDGRDPFSQLIWIISILWYLCESFFPIGLPVSVCQTGAWFCSNPALANVCFTSQNATWPPTFESIPVAGQRQNDTEDFGIPNSPPNAAIKDVHRDLHRSNKHGSNVNQKRFVYHGTSWPCILGEWTVDVNKFILLSYSRSPQTDGIQNTCPRKKVVLVTAASKHIQRQNNWHILNKLQLPHH